MRQDDLAKHFEKLIAQNELLIYKVCRIYVKSDADIKDLFQDILLQLWRSFPSFRGDSKFSTWLYRVAINTAIRAVNNQKALARNQESLAFSAVIVEDHCRTSEDQIKEMYSAIDKLNEIEKAIIMLYLEDRSYEEMEEVLGISQGTLRVKMNRIKDKIRQLTKLPEYGT